MRLIEEVALHLATTAMEARGRPCQAVGTARPCPSVRDAERRGEGWSAGYADIGWSSNSPGWYEGSRSLVATDPTGIIIIIIIIIITGFGFCAASATDQQAAQTSFAVRHRPDPGLSSAGSAAAGPYVTDKGFEGEENRRRRLDVYAARLIPTRPSATAASEAGPSA